MLGGLGVEEYREGGEGVAECMRERLGEERERSGL